MNKCPKWMKSSKNDARTTRVDNNIPMNERHGKCSLVKKLFTVYHK